jgi:hypothetical protein
VRILTIVTDEHGEEFVEFDLLGDIHYATGEEFRAACFGSGPREKLVSVAR